MTSNGRPPGSRIISIYDYPEHLNPFYEDDNHNKIRFWTVGRKKTRSNSFSLSGIRNAMTMRSFRGKKDLKPSQPEQQSTTLRTTSPHLARSTQSISVMEERSPTRYLYSGSVTPTPSPRLHARPEAQDNQSDSRLSINNGLEEPGRPPRAHRKKRRAPPPPVVEQIPNNVPEVKPDDEALKVVLKIEEDTKDDSHDERTDKLVTANDTIGTNASEEHREEMVPAVELKIIEDTEHPSAESTKTTSDTSSAVETIEHQDKSPIALDEKSIDLQITEEQNLSKETHAVENHINSETSTANITEVTISVNETTAEESNEDSSKAEVSVSSAEIMVSDMTEEVQTPIPKARTIGPSTNDIEAKGKAENAEIIKDTAPGTSGDDYERDMEAKLLADMEELDKSTHQIKEWLEELNDSSETSSPAPDKDDTNNNHVPGSPPVLYRSTSTISEGKHRSEISNVQLSPSQEDSPNCN